MGKREQLIYAEGNTFYRCEDESILYEGKREVLPPISRADIESIPGWKSMTPKQVYLAWLQRHPEVNVTEAEVEAMKFLILRPLVGPAAAAKLRHIRRASQHRE